MAKYVRLAVKTTPLLMVLLFLPYCTQAYEINKIIEKQSNEALSVVGYVGALLIVLLCMLTGVLLITKSKQAKQARQQIDGAKAQLDDLPTGIIHVNKQGLICYANLAAARLMGRDLQRLLNTELYTHFIDSDAALIHNNIAQNIELNNLQVQAKVSKLFVMIKAKYGSAQTAATVLTIEDQHHIQKALQQSVQHAEYQTQVVNTLAFATVSVDLNEQTYCYDAVCASMLHLDAINDNAQFSEAQLLRLLENKIHNADFSAWRKALQSQNKATAINCRIAINSADSAKTYMPVHMIISPPQHQAQREIYIQSNTEYELLKHDIDALNHQHQTLLHAINGPVYSLDDKGNVLWSNAAFMQFVRSINPANQSTNIFDMGIFPDNIITMHTTPPGVSSRTCNEVFDVEYSNGQTRRVKLNLAFYLHQHRLMNKGELGMVGVIEA
ncbi:MAG: PAS domain-containing protein [Glaciecola sp.]